MGKSIFRATSILAIALSMSACAATGVSRPKVVDPNGIPMYKENNFKGRAKYVQSSAELRGLQKRFYDAHQLTQGTGGESSDNLKKFMEAGFALVHLGCNTYIEAKSVQQRLGNTVRDSFVPATALITGIVGLANDGDTDSDLLTAVSLLTSASSAGFEIYEQRFLFGAENVDEVRSLVLDAQIAHASAAYADIEENSSYEQAVIHLTHNQMVCSPAYILRLVNEAIDTGDVKAIKKDIQTVETERSQIDGLPDEITTETLESPRLRSVEVKVE